MTSSFAALVDGSVMLSTESGTSEDAKKKRRLESGSSSDSDPPAKIIGKSKKKMRKLEMPPQASQPLDLRRALVQTHFEVFSKSLANIEARKDPNYVPIYKQKLYIDSPVSDDPYALPDSTPEKRVFPKKIRKQVISELGCSTSSASATVSTTSEAVTPDLPQNKQKRDTPWSPHPGALFRDKAKGTGTSVPDVGFTASPTSRIKSSKSTVNLFSKPAELISTPVRMPARSLLKSSGMSTSALRPRKPIDFDYGEPNSRQQPIGMTSPRKKVVVDLDKGAAGEKPSYSAVPSLRRQRSSSYGSLSKALRDEIDADPAAPTIAKRTRSRSVERQLSEEATSPPRSSRVLRETPERTRHRSASQERTNMKKSASSNNLALLKSAANVTVRSKLVKTCSAGSLASLASQPSTTRKTSSNKKALPEVITIETSSSSDGSQQTVVSTKPLPVSPIKAVAPSKAPTPMTSPRKKVVVAAASTPVKKQEPVMVVLQDSSGEEFYSVPSSPMKEPSIPLVSREDSDVFVLPSKSETPPSTDSSLNVVYQTQLPPPLSQQIVIPPPPIAHLSSSASTENSASVTVVPEVVQLSSSSTESTKTEDVVSSSQDSDVVPCSQELEAEKEPEMNVGSSLENEEVGSEAVADKEEIVPCSQEVYSTEDSSQASTATEAVCASPDVSLKSILKTPNSAKKDGRRIDFSHLHVYYFGRIQGFHVVPEHGDVALGMEYEHFNMREFKVLKTRRPRINMSDPDDSELSEGEDPGFDGFCRRTDFEKDNFERQRMLQNNGVAVERQKSAADLIRRSRKQCGCSCRGGICRPNTCECSRAGVPCQVDRQDADGRFFPCSCSIASLCNNEHGHLFYDYERVNDDRRSAIQRWKDMHKTGIYASPSVKRFESESDVEDEVVTDSQEGALSTPKREDFLLAPRLQGTPVYTNRAERIQKDDFASTPLAPPPRSPPKPVTSFFPPTPSLL